MAQNVYDNQQFFNAYSQLTRSQEGLDGAPEWPTLRNLAGDVAGCHVLDLGCGYGWFCRYAAETGAASVHGIDVSQKMLAKAKTFESKGNIEYECSDLQTTVLKVDHFDVVHSSLALHYLPDLRATMKQVASALKAGGCFVFSVEHPLMTSPSDDTWKRDSDGKVFWPLNDYGKEGLRVRDWLGTGAVHKYHHRLETYLMAVLEAGLTLEAVRESWDGSDLSCDPKIHESGHRPYFLLVKAVKQWEI